LLNRILDKIVAEDAPLNRVGEPLAAVDTMLRRFDFYTLTRVSGHVAPKQGKFVPGEPIYLTFRRVAGAPLSTPVTLDANGNFLVYIPEDVYNLAIKADKFLQAVVPGVNTNQGNIPSQYNTMTINVQLLVGDVNGDNVVDDADLAAMRRAWLSTPNASANWN